MNDQGPSSLGLAEARRAIDEGRLTAMELADACLARIERFEPEIEAFAFLDPDLVRQQAEAADALRRRGRETGPLHGVPIAVKDIFDTQDMPTEDGTTLHAGRTPGRDATAVAALRSAGAVILGKAATSELAGFTRPSTRNPHDASRTPGGSSSGSAAAVAAFMAPGAIGTQTSVSIVRPASYCGVWGYKPTFGLISRHRVLKLAPSLDTVGVYGRSLEDIALLAETLMVYDGNDPAMVPRAAPALGRLAAESPPMPPRIGFVRPEGYDSVDAALRTGIDELQALLGDQAEPATLPGSLNSADGHHRRIMAAEAAHNLQREMAAGRDGLSQRLREFLEEGLAVGAADYLESLDAGARLPLDLAELFDRYDALLLPADFGEAPVRDEAPAPLGLVTPWTLAGLPMVSMPVLRGTAGLPAGALLVGQRHDDARLMRTARWLMNRIDEETAP